MGELPVGLRAGSVGVSAWNFSDRPAVVLWCWEVCSVRFGRMRGSGMADQWVDGGCRRLGFCFCFPVCWWVRGERVREGEEEVHRDCSCSVVS